MKRFADAVGAVSLVWLASGAQAQVPEVELPELPDEILQPPLEEREDGMRFLPDVEGQFGSLSARPDPLGFHIDGTPGPTKCKHYQGVVRVQGADGTPFLLLTRSGNIPEIPYVPNDVACAGSELGNGNLVVIRMGSRSEKQGERMRSNRLARGRHVDDTVPPLEDEATIHFTFVDGGLVLRNGVGSIPYTYRHPGSMQAVGNVLAVPLEHRTSVSSEPTLVMFLDVSNPEDPKFLSQFAPTNGNGETLTGAGVVGLTPLADDHYLLLVTGGDNRNLFFYRSDLDGAEGLKSPDLTWSFVDSWNADPRDEYPCGENSRMDPASSNCLSPDERYLETNWPTDIGWAHQTLQFLRQSAVGGSLYLAGARGKYTSDESILDLYRIDCATPLCDFGEIRMKHVRTRHHKSGPPADGDRLVNFAAATSFYVSPGKDLLFYATEHDNDGPDGTVRAGEYRHIYMAHDYSPTFAPTATVAGPFEVDEGGSVALTGSTAPPTIRPFIQLFDALHPTNRFDGNYAVVDYPDYDLDDFDNLAAFEGGFKRAIYSWNWFAPTGCTITANLGAGLLSWELDLQGTGMVEHDPDLREIFDNLGADSRISSVDFRPDCDQYYATPIDLFWDLDLDGSYETENTFSAAQLDGPTEREVPAQALHPNGGPADYAVAKVIVRNVNPRVTGMRLLDGAGRPLPVQGFPVTVPQVLKNLPVTVDAAFTDAGVLDHQFVSVDWGDGSLDLHSSFTTFNDAFGDGTGAAVSRTHSYRAAGLRSVVFRVRDDDGGFGSRAASLRVITPQEAVEMTINTFDRLFARTPASAHPHLEESRRALTGIDPRTNDGALDMIRAGNRAAAIAFLEQSIASLKKAQGDSAVVAVIGVLGQTIDSLFAE